jgi:glutamate/tyrosine decarboxylase-like PLP-dependent enzyme
MQMGHYLRDQLRASGFEILNTTPLPIVCFRPQEDMFGKKDVEKLHRAILEDRGMWLSLYPIHGKTTLRACIANYSTQQEHIDQSVETIRRLAMDQDAV